MVVARTARHGLTLWWAAMITLSQITKTFPGTTTPAVDSLTLEINEGEVVVLVGPSGCGKTTTLKMINRLVEPTSGTITVAGQDILSLQAHELRRGIGYVIQQIGLFPHKTIAANIATVPTLLGWDRAVTAQRVDELVQLVELPAEMLDRYPSELSGGQRQRVGVARALAADPPVLLMDEPFGAVDPIVRANLQNELLDLQARLHKTIVLVTHDIDEALKLGDRVAILNVGGILEQFGSPEEILRAPQSEFVEEFLGGERGLKRLALMPASAAGVRRGPMIDRRATKEAALQAAAAEGTDWVGILDGDRLLGWLFTAAIAAAPTLADLAPKPFWVTLDCESSLREALDAVVTSHARVAVVLDRDRYVGMLDIDTIGEVVTE